MSGERVQVRKTYKLFIDGAFARSESGRSYEVRSSSGEMLANAVRASRKDLRDAVRAARTAWGGWSGMTAYNRGQVMYRIAEVMEARRAELSEVLVRAEGEEAASQVEDAVDTWVWYAGLTDKLTQIAGGLNQVAGPYFNISVPEPTGVAGIVAPETHSLSGLVTRLAAAVCGGNTVVAVVSEKHPLPAVVLAECLATSDVPPGVVNLLTGLYEELVPVLASHLDVDALDVTGVDANGIEEIERLAADNVKRIVKAGNEKSPYEATAFMELKTVWHPKGT